MCGELEKGCYGDDREIPMAESLDSPQVKTVVVFTADPWDGPIVHLRLAGPAKYARLDLIQGNQGDQIWPERVSEADIVVIQRDFPRFRKAYQTIVTLARANAIPILYETDDLLLDLGTDHSHYQTYRDVQLSILSAILDADMVTVSSQALADYLRPLNSSILVLPNFLDEKLWTFKHPEPLEQRPLVIGYMGGETHRSDLEYVEPVLRRVLTQYGDQCLLRFWGGAPPDGLLSLAQVDWVPFRQDHYASFAAFFQQVDADIFIAPLQDTIFNQCKSAIKFLEYSVHGRPGIYSQTPGYQEVIEQGRNGFLASSLDEWEKYLIHLIESPSTRALIGQAAQQSVSEKWLMSSNSHRWQQVYQQVRSSQKGGTRMKPTWATRISSILEQADVFQQEVATNLHQARVNLLESQRTLEDTLHTLEDTQHTLVHTRQTLDNTIQTLEHTQQILREKDAYIEELHHHIVGLQAHSNQLQEILESRSWRIIQKIHRLILRLAPPGSRRARLLRKIGMLSSHEKGLDPD